MPSKRKLDEVERKLENGQHHDGGGSESESTPTKKARKQPGVSKPWTVEEELALMRAVGKVGLGFATTFAHDVPELTGRDAAKINMKLRSLLKRVDLLLNGDGAWVATYKVPK